MPFTPNRLADLRAAKGLERKDLAELAHVSVSQVTKHENDDACSSDMIEKFADALDCTLDYLYSRGTQYSDAVEAAIQMSFDAFARKASAQQREWCRRVLLHHESRPRIAADWRVLAEHIEIATKPPRNGSDLRAVG